jgi:uncharacterized protein
MLLIDIPQIPPEGLEVEESLDPAVLHIEDETDFSLKPGGRLAAHVDLVDGTNVHVRGRLTASLGVECHRCLGPVVLSADQELDLFYLPRPEADDEASEDEVGLEDRDMVVSFYRGDRLDLGEIVREQLLLTLPVKRLCREDCRGLCPHCGKNWNLESCTCAAPEEAGDPRLAGLKKLFDRN